MADKVGTVSLVTVSDNSVFKVFDASVPVSSGLPTQHRARKDIALSTIASTQAQLKHSWKIHYEDKDAKGPVRTDCSELAMLPNTGQDQLLISAHGPTAPASTLPHSLFLHELCAGNVPVPRLLASSNHPIVGLEYMKAKEKLFIAYGNGEIQMATVTDDTLETTAPFSPLARTFSKCRVSADSAQSNVAALGAAGSLCSVVSLETGRELWRGKNLANDTLNMAVPIWDKDISWIPQSSELFAVSTAYGQVRLYDTRASKRPVINFELQEILAKDESIGKHQRLTHRENLFALNSIRANSWHSGAGYGFAVGSNRGHLYMIDTRVAQQQAQSTKDSGRVLYRLKGFQGAIRDIQISNDAPLLGACGLDRHVRLFDLSSFAPVATIYTKLPLSRLAILPEINADGPVSNEQQQNEQADSSEEDWDALAIAKDSKRIKRKQSNSKLLSKTMSKPKKQKTL